MYLSNQSLLVIIVVGIIAGWLAGRVMEGGGFGLIGDLIVGLIGAFIGDWLLPRLGIHLGTGVIALIINAFIGAVVLLLILRLASRSRPRWGRRWQLTQARAPLWRARRSVDRNAVGAGLTLPVGRSVPSL
jgi:uncharacterized membrane protein YeaQ/YmgE (transglycosylase-associated protein family)